MITESEIRSKYGVNADMVQFQVILEKELKKTIKRGKVVCKTLNAAHAIKEQYEKDGFTVTIIDFVPLA